MSAVDASSIDSHVLQKQQASAVDMIHVGFIENVVYRYNIFAKVKRIACFGRIVFGVYCLDKVSHKQQMERRERSVPVIPASIVWCGTAWFVLLWVDFNI